MTHIKYITMFFNALKTTSRYRHYILFKQANDVDFFIKPIVFWIATTIVCLVVNLPKDRIILIINEVLEQTHNLNHEFLVELVNSYKFKSSSDLIVDWMIIPLKSISFFTATLILVYPVLKSINREKYILVKSLKHLKEKLRVSIVIFICLSLLVFPFRFPLGSTAMGMEYAVQSSDPFAQNSGWYYRRILMPAVAHFFQMDSPILYYLFSIFCTYILIVATLVFVESKYLNLKDITNHTHLWNKKTKFIYYLSLGTSSYLIFNFQLPAYPEQFFFILLILAACIPMTSQERLSILVLSLITHEVSFFVFLPIVFLCFPHREIINYFYVIAIYFATWVVGTGFDPIGAIQFQMGEKGGFYYWSNTPFLGLAGLFFSYKLLWIIIVSLILRLWQYKEKSLILAIVCIMLFPALTCIPSVDTNRMVGMGFYGVLICFSILMNEYNKLAENKTFLRIAYINILVPSANVILPWGIIIYPGLYKLYKLIPIISDNL
ncbi:hypothetical protein [Coleofasciculus sp. A1-SPW-01]|uniref:hypothetical protein n=1 Tax=Coleofasciculus sp. A1-SPW-01 TaxID=3070819 RepID=UPI004063EB8B